MQPALQIKMVRENLALAISLWSAAKKGLITAANLPKQAAVTSDAGSLVVVTSPLELINDEGLVRCINNQIRGAFAFSVVQTSRTLEAVYGKSPLQEPDPDLKGARCAIDLLNRAMSQDLLEPAWVCPPGYKRRFEVRPLSFVLDATTLEGRAVSWDDFGGLEKYLALLEYCSSIVQHPPREWHTSGEAPAETAAFSEQKVDDATNSEAVATETSSDPDPLAGFIAARCVVSPGAQTTAKDLYTAYLAWCEGNGELALVRRSFGMQLTKRGFRRRRRGRGRHWWQGIGLAT